MTAYGVIESFQPGAPNIYPTLAPVWQWRGWYGGTGLQALWDDLNE
jgi:hypothetical protein